MGTSDRESARDAGVVRRPVRALFAAILSLNPLISKINATVWPSDGTPQSIQHLHDTSARDGDVITLPAGTFDWTTGVTITKNIIVQGQSNTFNTASYPDVATADDQTIILDDVPRGGNDFLFLLHSAGSVRLTGITFRAGTLNTYPNLAAVQMGSSTYNPSMRVDHCHFDRPYRRAFWVTGWTDGLIDHNLQDSQGHSAQFCLFQTPNYGNKIYGNGSWADFPYYGTNKFAFMEDNTIRAANGDDSGGSIDDMDGARFVVRHNVFISAIISGHGTESGIPRGNRCFEVYNNVFVHTGGTGGAGQERSGDSIWHDNTWPALAPGNDCIIALSVYRETYRWQLWGPATGQNPWDLNDTANPYATGICSTDMVPGRNIFTITDPTKNWIPNQWVSYMIRNEALGLPYSGYGTIILSNTNNSISFIQNHYSDNRADWVYFYAGQPFSINKVIQALDQSGTGKGDLIQGNPPINTVTHVASWPHPQAEPCISWNNIVTQTGETLGFTNNWGDSVVAGRDYFNLGGGFPANTIPAQVQTIYTVSVNGVAYQHEYVYPHPLQGGSQGDCSNQSAIE